MVRLHGWGVGRVVGAMVCGCLLATGAWAQTPQYSVVQLDVGNTTRSNAYGVNASGQVSGHATVNGGATRAVVWAGGVITDLGVNAGNFNVGYGINDAGWVAGYSFYTSLPESFAWQDGVVTALPERGTSQDPKRMRSTRPDSSWARCRTC